MLTVDLFDYQLPKERIAHKPASPRDQSRLLVVNTESGAVTHRHYHQLAETLIEKLGPNTVLVRNNTKVIPARIIGKKISEENPTGGAGVEILLTKRIGTATDQQLPGEMWECLTKPGLKPGQTVVFTDAGSELTATCSEITGYTRTMVFNRYGQDLFTELDAIGLTPIPPYITAWNKEDEPALRRLYQTTYAKHNGSAAAPTAGLHFTPELDQKIRAAGIDIIEVTLHVGLGTFLRVKETDISDHVMHEEWYSISEETAAQLNAAVDRHAKIVSVGTTTSRVLETCARQSQPQGAQLPHFTSSSGYTDIFLYPPAEFKAVDALLTNFHEPKSTLLMLVSAFCTTPNTSHQFRNFETTTVGTAYQTALQEKYRFLSFGDGMLLYQE